MSKPHVLLDNTNRVGGGYIELFDDGRLRAGYRKKPPKTNGSADEALVHFKEAHSHPGNLATGRICEALQHYIEQRDDGR